MIKQGKKWSVMKRNWGAWVDFSSCLLPLLLTHNSPYNKHKMILTTVKLYFIACSFEPSLNSLASEAYLPVIAENKAIPNGR